MSSNPVKPGAIKKRQNDTFIYLHRLTMNRAGISLLYGSLGNLGSEFWPDIDQKLFHRRPKAATLPLSQQPQK